jgi:hypothetical protein
VQLYSRERFFLMLTLSFAMVARRAYGGPLLDITGPLSGRFGRKVVRPPSDVIWATPRPARGREP